MIILILFIIFLQLASYKSAYVNENVIIRLQVCKKPLTDPEIGCSIPNDFQDILGSGEKFYNIVEDRMTFDNARQYCAMKSSYLFMPKTNAEIEFTKLTNPSK